jgi:beta-lactamase regulating signal transducer with metallopeptidase domain
VNSFTVAYLVRLEMWGLLAALVQGGLVWLSWMMSDRAMANASASFRHRLACAHFAAMLVLPVLTVAILHSTLASMALPAPSSSPEAELLPLMADHHTVLMLCLPLALLWLFGSAWMTLRLAMDAGRLAGLAREPAPPALTDAVHRLARDRVSARAPDVQLADVSSPQIIGVMRPALLAPRDLTARLSDAEQEAVLLHELAHLRRGDFFWNLIQRLMLAVLWFHPAAWKLYGHVAREREACCDAMAVRHGASAIALARALVRFAQRQTQPQLGMAISRQGELSARVHRLLGLAHPAPAIGQRVAAMVMPAWCLLALGIGRLGIADPAMADVYYASAFGPTISIDARDAAGSFALQIRQGRVIGATVDKQSLPQNQIVQVDRRVTLIGQSQQPLLALTVTPQGRIEWEGRSAKNPQPKAPL